MPDGGGWTADPPSDPRLPRPPDVRGVTLPLPRRRKGPAAAPRASGALEMAARRAGTWRRHRRVRCNKSRSVAWQCRTDRAAPGARCRYARRIDRRAYARIDAEMCARPAPARPLNGRKTTVSFLLLLSRGSDTRGQRDHRRRHGRSSAKPPQIGRPAPRCCGLARTGRCPAGPRGHSNLR
jgi:hypothetical protein